LTAAFAGVVLDRPRIMAIVNVTPDSFSDGGERLDPAQAIDDGLRFVSEGADIVDVGGESTRPGSRLTAAEEELRRVLPVIEGLARQGVLVSIDTRRASVARACLDAGARIVNDVSALRDDPDLMPLVAAEPGRSC
jgi:dihydropteroate synthase